jgi:hypothetical protein
MTAQRHRRHQPARREPVEVPEPNPVDRSLQQMKAIRKQRLQRAEAQAAATRRRCEEASTAVRSAIARTREMEQEAQTFWRETMASFLGNQLASSDLLRARSHYRRLQDSAAAQRIEAGQSVDELRLARAGRRSARTELRKAECANEKLVVWEEALQAEQWRPEP